MLMKFLQVTQIIVVTIHNEYNHFIFTITQEMLK
jgi:hypothetical protein